MNRFYYQIVAKKLLKFSKNHNHESSQQNVKLLINSICQSNLSQILLENCIEMCCERLSEFKLILLAEFVKNYVGSFDDFKDQLQRSIAPLLLVSL